MILIAIVHVQEETGEPLSAQFCCACEICGRMFIADNAPKDMCGACEAEVEKAFHSYSLNPRKEVIQ